MSSHHNISAFSMTTHVLNSSFAQTPRQLFNCAWDQFLTQASWLSSYCLLCCAVLQYRNTDGDATI